MGLPAPSLGLVLLFFLFFFARPARAFGAGNIASLSSVEGQNWRHGDVEDALLSLFMARIAGGHKFSKLDVKRVYFGNWLRDYSQAVDVGTVKYVSAEAIRILLWVLGFMSFGYGTREFEVTTERLGCYDPTEHIDNPLGYAEGEDARRYDPRLRGPVDEERELSIDTRTGLKNYIATEDIGINTSAGLVRRVFGRCIQLGRRYARSGDKADLYEALRLMGTGLHCLEDYAAHSNYTELSLIELGERDVFPHVGRRTLVELPGVDNPVYPIVTGTFGGVDFLHSVMGEFSDKATQSEIQCLEGAISDSEINAPSESLLQDLLDKVPEGILGGSNQKDKMDEFKAQAEDAKEHNQNISPREPEEWTRYLDEVQRQIYPVLEWHDEILKAINEAIEKIPVLPELIEQIQDQITMFAFSVIAPYVLPIISQVKKELETGSSEVIQSSLDKQHIVFNDDYSSNPTHSMLSKDHFSNVLNEPAGRIASQVVKWTVPQLMECWDDEDVDVDRTLDRIIHGVFHHPALREYGEDGASDIRQIMFRTVEEWWSEKGEEGQDILRQQLSREGVRSGQNHKEGVHDSGHGCGKPLGLPKHSGSSGGGQAPEASRIGKLAEEAVGGGALGSLIGGIVGNMGSKILSGGSGESRETKSYQEDRYEGDGSYGTSAEPENRRYGGYGDEETYGGAENTRRNIYQGERLEYEQSGYGGDSGYAYRESRENYPSAGEEYRQYKQPQQGYGSEYTYGESRDKYPSTGGEYRRRAELSSSRDEYGSTPGYDSGYGGRGEGYRESEDGYEYGSRRGYSQGFRSYYEGGDERGYEHERQRDYSREEDERRYGSDDGDQDEGYRHRYEDDSNGGEDEDDEHEGRRHHRHHHHYHHHHHHRSDDYKEEY